MCSLRTSHVKETHFLFKELASRWANVAPYSGKPLDTGLSAAFLGKLRKRELGRLSQHSVD